MGRFLNPPVKLTTAASKGGWGGVTAIFGSSFGGGGEQANNSGSRKQPRRMSQPVPWKRPRPADCERRKEATWHLAS